MRHSLREIQEIIAGELVRDKTLSDTARGLFSSTPTISESEVDLRFQAYRRNFLGARLKALADTYLRTKSLVGENYFLQIARRFARNTPSRNADLGDYGMEFPEFIQQQILPREEAQRVPYLADVASMERAIYRTARHRETIDETVVLFETVDSLGRAPAAINRFVLNPAQELVCSRFPLLDIWRAALGSAGEVTLSSEAHGVAVWIRAGESCLERVSKAEVWILEQIKLGESLERIIEKAPSDFQPETCIPDLMRKGLIIGYR